MRFVAVFCPLTTTGARETLAQTSGATRFVVDCKVNPPLLAGQLKTNAFGVREPAPAGLKLNASAGGEPDTEDSKVGENSEVLSPATP